MLDISYTQSARNFFTNTLIDGAVNTRDNCFKSFVPKKVDGILGNIQHSSFLAKADRFYINRGTVLFAAAIGAGIAYKYSETAATPLAALAGAFALSGSGNAFRSVLKVAAVTVVAITAAHYAMQEAEPTPYIP